MLLTPEETNTPASWLHWQERMAGGMTAVDPQDDPYDPQGAASTNNGCLLRPRRARERLFAATGTGAVHTKPGESRQR